MHLNHDILQNKDHSELISYVHLHVHNQSCKKCGLKVGDKDHPLIYTPQTTGRMELI